MEQCWLKTKAPKLTNIFHPTYEHCSLSVGGGGVKRGQAGGNAPPLPVIPPSSSIAGGGGGLLSGPNHSPAVKWDPLQQQPGKSNFEHAIDAFKISANTFKIPARSGH